MSYYKTIDGIKMDAKIIDEAELMVKGAGDGRISVKDAKSLLNLVTDGGIITDTERSTLDYIIRNYIWTSFALDWFNTELRIWQSHYEPVIMTLSDLSDKHFASLDVLTDPVDKAARIHALESATSETNLDHDDIGLWIRLNDGTTVEVYSNFIALENEFVQLRGGCIVPVKAIEKIEL
ncbi:MAG: hypothetical protein JJE09_01660 [Bacteroidia bacterium]|nr:hypothetical protein [Bacteroidia bacterium]